MGTEITDRERRATFAHPDEEWARNSMEAMEAWLAEPATSQTSAVTGGGAVGAVEREFGKRMGGRPSILVPSATYGLRAVLAAVGATHGTDVLVPAIDWPSSFAAVRSLGARAIPVAVDPATGTIDPEAAGCARTLATVAAVACHLHGVPADVPALRRALGPQVPVIEDAAQAFDSTLDGQPVGTLGDFAVFSMGPNKAITVGEAGVVVARDWASWECVQRQVAHPVRQHVSGLVPPSFGELSIRPHPVSAVLLWHALRLYSRPDAAGRARLESAVLAHGLVLGRDHRRTNESPLIPMSSSGPPAKSLCWSPTGARHIHPDRVGEVLETVHLISASS